MSAVIGTYGYGSEGPAIAARMSAALAHRGPDGEGAIARGSAALAHRRLAILDADGGAQPVVSADERFALVLDGSIHNHRELRAELEGLGHEVAGDSDAEVALAALAQWGLEGCDRFEGAFAIAVHDAQRDELTLVRDPLGIKPLYVHREGDGRLLFASEIKGLLAAQRFRPEPDDVAVFRYLKFRVQDEGERTFFAQVQRVRPGHALVFGAEGTRAVRCSRLEEELAALAQRPGRPFDEAAVAEFRERFTTAVRRRLSADAPVGVSLSGGVDSSSVASVIARALREDPADPALAAVGPQEQTFSAVFPRAVNDEEQYVDAVAAQYRDQIRSHRIRPTAEGFLADLEDFVRTQEEPVISSGPYAQYATMREASEHVKVLLDGQGADETLAGYDPYLLVRLQELRAQRRVPALLTEALGARGILSRMVRRRLRGAPQVPIEALLENDFAAAHADERAEMIETGLKPRLLQDVFRSSLPSLLRYEDRSTSRFGIEGRVPFLDAELLRFVFGLDESAIAHAGTTKRILRAAMEGIVPEAVLARRDKIGFTTPESAWFQQLESTLREVFSSESFATRGYFDARSVRALFEDFAQHPDEHGTLLFWRMLNVELWLREFIDDPAAEAAGECTTASDTASAAETASSAAAAQEEEPVAPKSDYAPNEGKELDLVSATDGRTWRRYPLQTELVGRGDQIEPIVRAHVERFFAGLPGGSVPTSARWCFVISEKIIAISQGRSWYTWEIRPRPAARVLSRFVTRTPAGIGLGDPTTMELAIREVGLPRVLAASAAGAVGKVIGRRGLFYEVVGANVRAIDGPTVYSAFPSNVSAKLPPKDPDAVSARLSAAIRGADIPETARASFVGTVVMDANDIGRNVLGTDTALPLADLEATFADNPLGQGRQRTPMAMLFDLGTAPRA